MTRNGKRLALLLTCARTSAGGSGSRSSRSTRSRRGRTRRRRSIGRAQAAPPRHDEEDEGRATEACRVGTEAADDRSPDPGRYVCDDGRDPVSTIPAFVRVPCTPETIAEKRSRVGLYRQRAAGRASPDHRRSAAACRAVGPIGVPACSRRRRGPRLVGVAICENGRFLARTRAPPLQPNESHHPPSPNASEINKPQITGDL